MKKINALFAGTFLALCLGITGIAGHNFHANHTNSQAYEQNHKPVAVVFDLGGVLFDTSKYTVFKQLGVKNVLKYMIRHGSPQKLKARLYTTLNRITNTNGNTYGVKDPDGELIPQIMVEWLKQAESNKSILDRILNKIETHPTWFAGTTEQQVIKAAACAIFSPEQFAASRKFIPQMVSFAKELKQRNVPLYVLSNWDAESFDLLTKKYPEFFELFDGLIISGKVHALKPEPTVYAMVQNAAPNYNCVLIDDQKENIQAARKAGMCGILATQKHSSMRSSPDLGRIKLKLAKLENKQFSPLPHGTAKK